MMYSRPSMSPAAIRVPSGEKSTALTRLSVSLQLDLVSDGPDGSSAMITDR